MCPVQDDVPYLPDVLIDLGQKAISLDIAIILARQLRLQ